VKYIKHRQTFISLTKVKTVSSQLYTNSGLQEIALDGQQPSLVRQKLFVQQPSATTNNCMSNQLYPGLPVNMITPFFTTTHLNDKVLRFLPRFITVLCK